MHDHQQLKKAGISASGQEPADLSVPIQLKQAMAQLPADKQRQLLQPGRPLAMLDSRAEEAPVQMEEEGKGSKSALPAAIPQTPEEVADSLGSASVSVTAKKGRVLGQQGPVTLKMQDNTRLSAEISTYGLSISADPGFVADVKWLPDGVIKSLHYDFNTAKFKVSAEGLGPDAIYSAGATYVANSYFKPKLPAAMREPGYYPQGDPDTIGTFKALTGIFDLDVEKSMAQAGPSVKDALSKLDGFTDLSVEVGFSLKGGLDIPLEGGKAKLTIKPGTYFYLSGNLAGPVSNPMLAQIELRAESGGEIEVKMTEGFAAELAGLKIHSIRILPGGKLVLDYDLIVEQFGEGLIALAKLFGALATRDPRVLEGGVPDIKLNSFRAMVDEKVAQQVTPQFIALIRQYDQAVPGFSLVKAMGL